MKGFQPKSAKFKDARGKWRTLYATTLVKREKLRLGLLEISEYVKEADQELTFTELYDGDDYFRYIVDEALEAGGLKPSWLTHDMMLSFILPHKDGEGKLHKQGILLEINFEEQVEKTQGKPTTYPELLAILWGAMDNLEQALRVGDSLPHDLLLSILEARAEQMEDPEVRYKREQKAKAKEDIAKNGLYIVGDEVDLELDLT